MAEERTILDQDGIKVTTARFMVAGQTYAMANITSVKRGQEKPKYTLPALLVLAGLVGLMADGAGAKVFGVLLAGLGAFLFYRARPRYTVALQTSGGETTAFASYDAGQVEGIVAAVNEAIATR